MKFWSTLCLSALGAWFAAAVSNGESSVTIPTPTDCSTVTQTAYGMDTTVTDFEAFWTSLQVAYPSLTDPKVAIYTELATDLEGHEYTATFFYDSNALVSLGISVTSYYVTTTECAPVLPPSPTGSICSPHIDHWHCQPLSTGTTTGPPATTCSPHNDHWHCPAGVPEPTAPPTEEDFGGEKSDECVPHIDHWHCPPGVPEPTYLPGDEPDHEDASDESHAAAPSKTQTAENSGGLQHGNAHGSVILFILGTMVFFFQN